MVEKRTSISLLINKCTIKGSNQGWSPFSVDALMFSLKHRYVFKKDAYICSAL